MPIHQDKLFAWFERKLTALLKESVDKGVPDAGVVTVLQGMLQAYIESAHAVLSVVGADEEEDDGSVEYIA